jgi:hypothetical protein
MSNGASPIARVLHESLVSRLVARVAVRGTGIMGAVGAEPAARRTRGDRLEPHARQAAAGHLRLPQLAATARQCDRAVDLGHGDEDMSAVWYATA